MDRRGARPGAHPAGCAVLVLLALSGCVAAPNRPAEDSAVAGPEWRTTPRRSVGAATEVTPARLTGVAVEEKGRYDRVRFRFVGERPGYLVAYDSATPATLRIILEHVTARGGSRLTPELEAVREVRQRPAVGGVVETTVTPEGDATTPFRVGLSTGGFYVDIAHPDWATTR